MLLEGKTVLITGGCSGLGKETALLLASEGADIIIFDMVVKEEVLDEIRAKGRKAEAFEANVADWDDVKDKVAAAVKEFGKIDVLINSAGIRRDTIIPMMKEDQWDSVLAVNLKGTFNMIKHCSRYFIKQKGGKIINIASVAGLIGNAGQANYAATKAAVIGLTKTTAKELASKGITCNAIAPGFIETPMTANLGDKAHELMEQIPMKRMGKPAEVANVLLFLASDMSSYVNGETIRIDGGIAM